MRFAKSFLGAMLLLLPLFLTNNAYGYDVSDDYKPDVTARVARISFLRGDVQIKRIDSLEWERAALNLPIVEGDEIATDKGARLEIQFDSYKYLRLAENAYLKITTLRDEGIAVSLPQGTMNLRVLEFDKDRQYFEIDAPQTTVAVQQAGMYRVDAGDQTSKDVRITVTEDGFARVYSENSGFTLRSGRSARFYLEGSFAGEWETADASRYADEFDEWALERDAAIAKRLKDAYYDKYYDRDIYGAEDLSQHGEWVYTRKYGWVWRPFQNSVAGYSDWSPYRYGHWRWIPPYGWTWVNDEPWGWATYHYGRWIYIDGGWYWTPYGYYRASRSWWHPALVIIASSGSSICWYPLPYNYGYYNYNSHYHKKKTIINTTIIVNPTPTPNASPTPPVVSTPLPRNPGIPPFQVIPPSGVVTVAASEFGRAKSGFLTPPLEVAKKVLATAPDENQTPPLLPTFKELNGKVSRDILVESVKAPKPNTQFKTGVIDRTIGAPLDETLRKERVFGNRTPVIQNQNTEVKTGADTKINTEMNTPIRNTGAVKREQPVIKQDADGDTPIRQTPQKIDRDDDTPIRSTGGGRVDRKKDDDQPIRNQRKEDRNDSPPVYIPPPPQKQRDEPVKPQPPPPKESPKSEPKSEPKNDSKPPPLENKGKGKDG